MNPGDMENAGFLTALAGFAQLAYWIYLDYIYCESLTGRLAGLCPTVVGGQFAVFFYLGSFLVIGGVAVFVFSHGDLFSSASGNVCEKKRDG